MQRQVCHPADLRQEVLKVIHAGHAGVTIMLNKATQSFFWPKLCQDIIDIRAHCKDCMYMSPSNQAPPLTAPENPDFSFSHLCIDFFQIEFTYLAIDDSANIITKLRQYFTQWGAAKEITSDGAPVFCSKAIETFLHRWGSTTEYHRPTTPEPTKGPNLQ